MSKSPTETEECVGHRRSGGPRNVEKINLGRRSMCAENGPRTNPTLQKSKQFENCVISDRGISISCRPSPVLVGR